MKDSKKIVRSPAGMIATVCSELGYAMENLSLYICHQAAGLKIQRCQNWIQRSGGTSAQDLASAPYAISLRQQVSEIHR